MSAGAMQIFRGCVFRARFRCLKEDGSPQDLTGATEAYFSVRPGPSLTPEVVYMHTTGEISFDVTAGLIDVEIAAEATGDIELSQGWYDLEIVPVDGERLHISGGSLAVT